MNNKGFTLVELLATIAILSIITIVTIVSVTSYYDKSRKKTEEIFNSNLINYTMDLISLNGAKNKKFTTDKNYNYQKCYTSNSKIICKDTIIEYSNNYTIEEVEENITNENIINPVTKKKCTNNNLDITIYRDSDFVYCTTISPKDEENSCINNIITNCNDKYKDTETNKYIDFTKRIKE